MKKKKIGFALSGVLSVALLVGIGGSLGAVAEETPPQPSDYEKRSVFMSEDNDGVSEITENVALPLYCYKDTPVGKSDAGIAVYSETGSASFTYVNEIDMSDKTKSDRLIELYALSDGELADMNTLTVTLTDSENAANTVAVYFHFQSNAIYARVNYKGKSLAESNEQASFYLHNNNYGAWCSTNYFTAPRDNVGKVKEGIVRPFSIALDYQTRGVYLVLDNEKQHLMLDLDDVSYVGQGFLWDGFEKDRAVMSVSMGFKQAKKGGLVIKSINDNNLEGSFEKAEDFPAPSIKYLCDKSYLTEMPVAGVGVAYPIPDVYASDWFFGECENVTAEIFKYDTSLNDYAKVTADLSSGAFTPTEIGDYRIVYTAQNQFASGTSYLDFKTVEELAPIIVVQRESYATPVLMQSLTIPEVDVYGGSGIVDVKETLYYNGQEIALNQSRTVTVSEAGVISLRVKCKGYTGETVVNHFPVEIEENAVLIVEEVPMVLETGLPVVFPAALAYDSATGESAAVKIYADGVELDASRMVTTTKTEGFVTVRYVATSVSGEREVVYTIPVRDTSPDNAFGGEIYPTMYMIPANGAPVITGSDAGMLFTTEQTDSEIYWAFPVASGYTSSSAYINIAGLAGKLHFEYVDVILSDYANPTNQIFMRFYRECDAGEGLTYVQINGTGSKYLINGTLNNPNSLLRFYINTGAGFVYNANTRSEVCALPDYKAMASKVSFRLGGVDGEAGIAITEIGNQSLRNPAQDKSWNNAGPMISYSAALARDAYVPVGSTFTLPKASAYDLRSTGATVSVQVKKPDGTKTALSDGDTVSLDKAGRYIVVYEAEDIDGVSTTDEYYYNAVDQIAPTLTIEKTVVSSLKVGSTIVLPTATATDNLDTDLKICVYVTYVPDVSIVEVKMGEKYTFVKTGEYKIRYFTHDSDYNYTEYIMTVTVTE